MFLQAADKRYANFSHPISTTCRPDAACGARGSCDARINASRGLSYDAASGGIPCQGQRNQPRSWTARAARIDCRSAGLVFSRHIISTAPFLSAAVAVNMTFTDKDLQTPYSYLRYLDE